MFRRRRRFKQRLQWFPGIGTELTAQTGFDRSPSGRFFSIGGLTAGNPSQTIETELTFDQPAEEEVLTLGGAGLVNAMSLSAWQASSWRLRRIVGKAFIGAVLEDQSDATSAAPAILVTVGFIVRAVDASSGGPVLSIGDQAVDTLDAVRDPWIWRRQWLLATRPDTATNGVFEAMSNFPRTTAGYGSVQDGPHIDQKTNRIIGPQERLILNITATVTPMPVPASEVVPAQCHGYIDYRLLGSLMKSTNRRNASR